jgi:hypothetical protein
MLSAKLKEAAGNSADATLYVDDVFSTWLYTGTGAAQTITNGIDLAGKGGLVWVKSRSAATNNFLFDTTRGVNVEINSNTTDANATLANSVTAFNSSGFALGSAAGINVSAATYASWTFREAAKFFDVVTYTGTGSARTIAHSLGVAPGMIIVKCTSTNSTNWQVYSNGLTSAAYSMQLNSTNAQASAPTVWNSTAPTSSVFSVGTDATVNASGGTYVAYLYAHDTSSTGIIQCGSYTGSASTVSINLGWEPQYVLIKPSTTVSGWVIVDSMRGTPVGGQNARLYADASYSESTGINGPVSPTATGFTVPSTDIGWNNNGQTYIYMAIRRPNKPPTTGTQVFSPNLQAGGGTVTTNFPVDLTITTKPSGFPRYAVDRLRGSSTASCQYLVTNSTAAEVALSGAGFGYDNNTGYKDNGFYGSGETPIYWNFKRAPGFFDEVCYTGTNPAQTLSHNLTVAPELIIVKRRLYADNWAVYSAALGNQTRLKLNATDAQYAPPTSVFWNSTTPTATTFTVGTFSEMNGAGNTFVAYLFATLAGISKVGSYTGNGTGQAIACGFGSGGARFVLIKRTDSTGDWYTYDSARGLTSGSSPYLRLNSTAAEVTGNNGVYASSGGFTLGATAITTTNIATASYIFLAVA